MSKLEELPVRLAHRVKELDELPHRLNEMPHIVRVKEWYAQSFEVSCGPPSGGPGNKKLNLCTYQKELVTFPPYVPPPDLQKILNESLKKSNAPHLPEPMPNTAMFKYNLQKAPTINGHQDAVPLEKSTNCNGKGKFRVPIAKR